VNNDLIPRELNGIVVYQREDNGYVNITALAKAYLEKTGIRREPHKWLNNKRTQESFKHLATVMQIKRFGTD